MGRARRARPPARYSAATRRALSCSVASPAKRRSASKQGLEFSKAAVDAIQAHTWPGNIRELTNRIRRSVVMADCPLIGPEHLGLVALSNVSPEPFHCNGLSLKEAKSKFEASLISQVLTKHNGNVSLAAKALQTSRSMLYNLIQKHNLGNNLPKYQAG